MRCDKMPGTNERNMKTSSRISFSLVSILLALLCSGLTSKGDDYTAWAYKLQITFPGYNKPETLTNFPALVVLNSNLSGFSYGMFGSTNGYDLRFATSDSLTNLNYEIEQWNTNGNSYVWVQIPQLSSNCSIWAYWGDTDYAVTSSPAAYTINGSTWPASSFAGVWHMNQSNALDSTANTNNGIAMGNVTNTAGVVGGGQVVTGSYVKIANSPSLNFATSAATISGWVRFNALPTGNGTEQAITRNENDWSLEAIVDNGSTLEMRSVLATSGTSGWTASNDDVFKPALSVGQWYFFAFTYNGAQLCNYENGKQIGAHTVTGTVKPSLNSIGLGGSGSGADTLANASIDEIRAEQVFRSTNWIWASYMTMASNPSLTTYGNVRKTAIHTITATVAGAYGSINPSGNVSVNDADSQTFSMSNSTGYQISSLIVDSVSVNLTNSYTFVNVTTDHTITVSFAINHYTITASASGNGSISSHGSNDVIYGGSLTFTNVPNFNFHIADVDVDGSSVGTPRSYTFTNIMASHTIIATFATNVGTYYTITSSADTNGYIDPLGTIQVAQGSGQTYTMTNVIGYHMTNVLVDGSSIGVTNSYSFNNMLANHTIGAFFGINHYTITATGDANGAVLPSGNNDLTYGSSQIFTVSPNSGYEIQDVLVDGNSIGVTSSYTFINIVASHTISASFLPLPCNLIVVSPFGAPNPPPGTNLLQGDVICSIDGSPTPSQGGTNTDGFETGDFSKMAWSNATSNAWTIVTNDVHSGVYSARSGTIGDSQSTTLQLNMVCTNGTMTFWRKVSSEKDFDTLRFYIDGTQHGVWSGTTGGWNQISVAISAGTHLFKWIYSKDESTSAGQDCAWIDDVAVPVPDPGAQWNCSGWSGTGRVPLNGTGTNTASFTLDQVSSITWIWTLQYWLDIAAGSNGSVDAESGWYDSTSLVSIAAMPDSGYIFAGWSGDVSPASSSDNPLVLQMNEPRSITANFVAGTGVYHTVTVTAGSNGVIAPSGTVAVLHGANRSFLIIPNPGYLVSNVTVDLVSVGATNSYMFVNVTGNHTITATFSGGFAAKGTPISWFNSYGLAGDYNALELADPDGDGLATWQEYIAGTDPTNPNSKFSTIITNAAGKIIVSFASVQATGPNYPQEMRYYDMQYSTNLMASPAWQAVPGYTGIVGSGSLIVYTNATSNKMGAYRVNVRLQAQ
jgi:hypothetical protein